MNKTLLTAILSLISLSCLTVFFFETSRQYSLVENALITPVRTGSMTNKLMTKDIDLSNYSEMIERPLFVEDRRPLRSESSLEKKVFSTATQQNTYKVMDFYVLNAVIITPINRIALIRDDRTNVSNQLLLGEDINGWVLIQIESDSVILEKNKQTRILNIFNELLPQNSDKTANALPLKANNEPQRVSSFRTDFENDDDDVYE